MLNKNYNIKQELKFKDESKEKNICKINCGNFDVRIIDMQNGRQRIRRYCFKKGNEMQIFGTKCIQLKAFKYIFHIKSPLKG